MNKLMQYIFRTIILTSVLSAANAQSIPEQFWQDAQQTRLIDKSKVSQDKMLWWRNARFGMLIQWNMSSIVVGEISWCKDFTNGEDILNKRPDIGGKETETQRWWNSIMPRIPATVYDNLHKSFYPAMFDAEQWVALAKNAGMKYIILTAKHHDGFCLWDSRYTEYDIKSTPFKEDILDKVAKATVEAGLKFGIYYSQRDWSYPDYSSNPQRYNQYMRDQIKELLEKYKEISILYFDAENYGPETWEAEKLFKMVAKMNPDIIINNRCGVSGDFDTPEERPGDFPSNRNWEASMTFGKKFSWGGFGEGLISFKEFLANLVYCAGNDGNLLMNVNPLPTGEIDPRQVKLLTEMGEWIKNYGESVYGMRGGPVLPGLWGASTCNDSLIYLHVLDWKQMPARMPGFGHEILSATLLTGGEVEISQQHDSLRISVSEEFRNNIDTIIKIKVNNDVSAVPFTHINLPHKTANPDASEKAKALLDYLYEITGKKTLTGQHNYIGRMSESTDKVVEITGKYPAIWGGDFGFADSTWDHDNIKYRAFIVDEIKKHHRNGSIITLTYHQANPLMGEPCPWRGGVNGSKLTSAEWDSLLTPRTKLNLAWEKQMDIIATYLKELRDADIPILWRPYHEMNGGWFWWGAKPNGFISLWKMLFDYYTNYHKLNNLIWVWAPDKPIYGLEEYYPGDDYVDIISVDIYPVGDNPVVFKQEWYDRVVQFARGKPIALSENGTLPTPKELNTQPKWTWFMTWAGLIERMNSKADIINLYNAYQTLTRDEIQSAKFNENSAENQIRNDLIKSVLAKKHSAVTPVEQTIQEVVEWWQPRHNAISERLKQGNVDLLFIGDSITQGWDNTGKEYWDKYYKSRNAVNMGCGWDRTQHVLWRIDHSNFANISPKLAIIMIGTNNSNADDNTGEEIADGIISICQRLRGRLPEMKILLLAIFPRDPDPSMQRLKNETASNLAAKIADGKMIHYLDINNNFLKEDGILTKDIMPDYLHLNAAGYKIWAEAMEAKVGQLMGEVQ